MTKYALSRPVLVGSLRRQLRPGTRVVLADDGCAYLEDTLEVYPNFHEAFGKGWLKLVDEPVSTAFVRGLQRVPPKEVKTTAGGMVDPSKEEWIEGSSEVDGWKEHRWGPLGIGETDPTCSVCGLTRLDSVIRADRRSANGQPQVSYRDAMGVPFTTSVKLYCPSYAGDAQTAALLAKQETRRVREYAHEIDDRVVHLSEDVVVLNDDVETLKSETSGINAKLADLEQGLEEAVDRVLKMVSPERLREMLDSMVGARPSIGRDLSVDLMMEDDARAMKDAAEAVEVPRGEATADPEEGKG